MGINFREEEELFTLKVDDTAKSHLLETMRWTKFMGILFSVLSLVFCLLIAFMVLFYLPTYMQTPTPVSIPVLIVTILIVLGVYFYPIFALLKFSSLIKKAIGSNSQPLFNDALRYLKNLFKYIGITTIIGIAFYGIIIGLSLMPR